MMNTPQDWTPYLNTATGLRATAVQITALVQASDGSALVTPNGGFSKIYLTTAFVTLNKPVINGWLVFINAQIVYYSNAAFVAGFTQAGIGNSATADKLSTARAIQISSGATGTANFDGSAAINIVATLATPTASLRGGVLQQSAITVLTDSSGGVSGGNTVPSVPAATAASVDTSAASLTSTNAAITAMKNDIATLSAKVTAMITAYKAAGLSA